RLLATTDALVPSPTSVSTIARSDGRRLEAKDVEPDPLVVDPARSFDRALGRVVDGSRPESACGRVVLDHPDFPHARESCEQQTCGGAANSVASKAAHDEELRHVGHSRGSGDHGYCAHEQIGSATCRGN